MAAKDLVLAMIVVPTCGTKGTIPNLDFRTGQELCVCVQMETTLSSFYHFSLTQLSYKV